LANDDNRSLTQLLRELYFSWTGIVFLIMALISVLMLVASAETHGTVSQFWLAVGSAVLATTGYSFVQTLLTTRQFNRFLSGTIQDDIRKEITKSTDEAMQIFRSARGRYLPSKTYPAHMSMDPAFNRDLNDSLSRSEHYVYPAEIRPARISLHGTATRRPGRDLRRRHLHHAFQRKFRRTSHFPGHR
jgi:hypothetical protein